MAPSWMLWYPGRQSVIRTGQAQEFIGVIADSTELKLAKEALIRTEKLSAAGRLAASIAHEINNPLEAVTNLLYLAPSRRKEHRIFLPWRMRNWPAYASDETDTGFLPRLRRARAD